MDNFYCRSIASMLILFLISVSVLNAQVTTASINGVVTDKSGQPLPGASIRVIHEPSGTQYGTSTREDGRFNLQGLRVGGPYSIHVTFIGYKNQDQSNLKLELAQNLQINFNMTEEVVQMGEVEIIGERSPVLSASRTGAASNVSRDNIDRLPTISRNFHGLFKVIAIFYRQ